jgi:hypothetical protein
MQINAALTDEHQIGLELTHRSETREKQHRGSQHVSPTGARAGLVYCVEIELN